MADNTVSMVASGCGRSLHSSLPEELILRCLHLLHPMGSHAGVAATCRATRVVACDDRLWAERLARDFPLASRAKPVGTLHRTYRMLAKNQPKARRCRLADSSGSFDDFEVPPDRTAQCRVEIQRMAAQFRTLNCGVDLDDVVMPRRAPVVIAPRPQRPVGAPDRSALMAELLARTATFREAELLTAQ